MEKFAREREQTPDRAERTDTLVWGKNYRDTSFCIWIDFQKDISGRNFQENAGLQAE